MKNASSKCSDIVDSVVAVSIVRLVATIDIGAPKDNTYEYAWAFIWS